MIVAMQEGADEQLIQQVIEHLVKIGFEVHRSTGARMTVLGAVGSGIDFDIRNVELLPGVQEVHRISSPYKLAGRSFRPEGTIVKLGNGIEIGFVVRLENGNAERTKQIAHGRVCGLVGAGDAVALELQQAGERGHSRAADADEVDVTWRRSHFFTAGSRISS